MTTAGNSSKKLGGPKSSLGGPKSSARQTVPGGWNPYAQGGLGILPRRDVADPAFLLTRYGLSGFAQGSPLRLLELLRSVHPTLAQATDNVLGLLCPPDGLRLVALKESGAGAGDDATDDAGTALLDDLWASLPGEAGGLEGLLSAGLLSLMFTGLTCLEAVPGPRMRGLWRLWPVDPLTITFGRDDADSGVVPYQRQAAAAGGYQRLDPATFFWRSLDGDVDNPYGAARLGAFLSQGLASLSTDQSLRRFLDRTGRPRLSVGVDMENLYKIATERLNLTADEASDWVMARYDELATKFQTMEDDDTFINDKNGVVGVLEGGKGMNNSAGVLERFDRHGAQALKTRPVLVGMNDSTTETQATVQWAIEGRTLERLRAAAVAPLLWAANLHLRLLGRALTAKAEYEPIRTTDAIVEAKTEAAKIANEQQKLYMGWTTPEQASMAVTGSGIPKGNEDKASKAAEAPAAPGPGDVSPVQEPAKGD